MYALGGFTYNPDAETGQTFSIDLSTSWSIHSPVYTQLPSMVTGTQIPSALIDNEIWYVISGGTNSGAVGYEYNITSQSWRTLSPQLNITEKGRSAVYSPITRRVYVPNGSRRSLEPSVLLIYDYDSGSYFDVDMPPVISDIINYSSAWAPTIQSVLVFGGKLGNTWNTRNGLFAYSSVDGWENRITYGAIPPERAMACLVSAYSGSKMILFGGTTSGSDPLSNGVIYGDIYILDVATSTWTKGTNAPAALGGVYGHICAYSNDQLIVWGGYSVESTTNDAFVYNLKTSTWTDKFVSLKESQSDHSKPGQGGKNDHDDQNPKPNSVPIIAGAVGGAVALVAIVGFILYRRKSKSKPLSDSYQQPVHKPAEALPQAENLNYIEPQNLQVQQPLLDAQHSVPQPQPQSQFQPQYENQNQYQNQCQYQYQNQLVADSVVQSTLEVSPMPSEWSGNQLSLNNTNSGGPQTSIALTNSESSKPPVVHGPQLYPHNEFQ
ncbi:hypothetical protein BGZ76_006147 [Entomortierella beljakovae]|nr:hypothetical protein BGZ76_006147 [Entomortierella beljakovae]